MIAAAIPPTESPDLRIRALARKREWLGVQLARVTQLLCTYASVQPKEQPRHAEVDALDHASIMENGMCGCEVCVEWRTRREEFKSALEFVPQGHRWSICACPACRFVGQMHVNFTAATNKRDLLIEMAFHATYHTMHSREVMGWLHQEMKNPRYTPDWCAYEIGRRPMEVWLEACETALSPMLSGTVFIAAEGKRSVLPVAMASHLGDVCAFAPG